MDLNIDLYLERAEGEIILSKANFNLSTKEEIKNILNIPLNKTFFNNVISESYYSIFYAAKAYLLGKNIITETPNEHQKTYYELKKFVESGELDKELIEIYDIEGEKAKVLLKILLDEKRKRGSFTYKVNANANLPFAEQSIENAIKFVSKIKAIIENNKNKNTK